MVPEIQISKTLSNGFALLSYQIFMDREGVGFMKTGIQAEQLFGYGVQLLVEGFMFGQNFAHTMQQRF